MLMLMVKMKVMMMLRLTVMMLMLVSLDMMMLMMMLLILEVTEDGSMSHQLFQKKYFDNLLPLYALDKSIGSRLLVVQRW